MKKYHYTWLALRMYSMRSYNKEKIQSPMRIFSNTQWANWWQWNNNSKTHNSRWGSNRIKSKIFCSTTMVSREYSTLRILKLPWLLTIEKIWSNSTIKIWRVLENIHLEKICTMGDAQLSSILTIVRWRWDLGYYWRILRYSQYIFLIIYIKHRLNYNNQH